MIKSTPPSIDLDQLLAIVEQRGCACNRLFYGPCLAHYAEQQRDGGSGTRSYTKNDPKRQEEFYVRPDRSARPGDSPRGGGRSDATVRGDSRSDDRGNGKRPTKAAGKPARKR